MEKGGGGSKEEREDKGALEGISRSTSTPIDPTSKDNRQGKMHLLGKTVEGWGPPTLQSQGLMHWEGA